jgi:hypothetical protein
LHPCPLYFALDRKNTLLHYRFTSLVIGRFVTIHNHTPCYQGQRGFSFFMMGDQGERAGSAAEPKGPMVDVAGEDEALAGFPLPPRLVFCVLLGNQ